MEIYIDVEFHAESEQICVFLFLPLKNCIQPEWVEHSKTPVFWLLLPRLLPWKTRVWGNWRIFDFESSIWSGGFYLLGSSIYSSKSDRIVQISDTFSTTRTAPQLKIGLYRSQGFTPVENPCRIVPAPIKQQIQQSWNRISAVNFMMHNEASDRAWIRASRYWFLCNQ